MPLPSYTKALHNRFPDETLTAAKGSCSAAGATQVPTGLKLIFRCSVRAGDEPRRCSQDSIELTLCRDMMNVQIEKPKEAKGRIFKPSKISGNR